ncbi:hypothetical protein EAI_05895, partial [Harpegnathos saltator]
ELSEDDFDRRMEFCDTLMIRFDDNNQFFTWICFSDETIFELNGSVNRYNLRYWTDENPHWTRDYHTQYLQKINVWAGIFSNSIIGSFFLDGNLLQNRVVPAIRNIVGDAFGHVLFQQDGAPPHFDLNVRHFLHETFVG